jgi:hypothetical protein
VKFEVIREIRVYNISAFMKKLILIALITTTFGGAVKAQNKFNAADFKANLGKTGTLCDTVYSLKIVSDSLTLLNMGGAYPHQKYTIAVKGNKVTLDLPNIKRKAVCVTGVFEMFKDQPEVVASRPEQFEVH